MNKFAEKSLVVPFYHIDLKSYIYGIHDIHLNYLKDVTRSRIISLHKKLISGYDRVTNGNYASLPNDNYTLQYIGYHLYKAEDFNKFDIYFDLKFLEAKIRAVGKQDVLRDMKKYEHYITNNDNILKEKLDQYREFVNRCGCNIYNYEKTDIIQFALGEPKDSIVYKEVDEYDHSTINVRDDITSACYVDSPNHILIGTTSGKIKLFFEESEKDISIFVGHTSGITKLVVSPDKQYFLSVSTDGSVMLWKFTADSSRNSFDFSESNLPVSPKTKQKYWLDVFTSDRGQIKPRRTFLLEEEDDFLTTAAFCDQFPEEFRIVTGSSRGNAIIWDGESGEQLRETGARGYNISSIIYIKLETDDRVIFSCEDNIHIYTFNERIHYTTLHSNDYFRSIYFADNRIIAVSDKSITLWKQYKLDKIILEIQETEMYHTCSTLTDDSHYLVVSTNLNTVYVWDFDEEKIVKKFKSKGRNMWYMWYNSI
ncbi:hypothetical protein NQ318_018314 [Aromia moschata]|uniref:APAF-1 helical domain-containing protein n=1 Tax=Aromia moschata TaxID=1265417 RepID=A0AAV8ZG36_9CUCU|nr:hypothetical protein NQ318_018314 [Aromia moschata]